LAEWRIEKCERDWGEWKVLNNYNNTTKVKELVVFPGQSLSWQKHENRSELWFVRQGLATVHYSIDYDGKDVRTAWIQKHRTFTLEQGKWHQLVNETEEFLSVIEIQYGSNCDEYDIIRSKRPATISY
jgi:mannose-6-phosphate isomerase-like protein (cupin superfamily)